VAIIGSLSLFLFQLSRLLSGAPGNHWRATGVVASGAWLLFAIAGGYVWFRVMSVVQPA
jgi:hypothetical protein